MKKYFVCSDIHGFYKEWMKSLKKAGYDKDNEDHILIVLGDIFDRGYEPYKVYKFLTSLPDDRVVLVKGNHEYLIEELVKRGEELDHDIYNGTYETLISLYKDPKDVQMKWVEKNENNYDDEYEFWADAFDVYRKVHKKLFNNKKLNEVLEWLKSPKWLHYYELGQYIFVHSFIPVTKDISYFPEWRTKSTPSMWEAATWGCPYIYYQGGLFDEEEAKGKILVCGHWHTSDFYNELLHKDDPSKELNIYESNPIFQSEKYPGLIGIDACTALTKVVNVLVIDESQLS